MQELQSQGADGFVYKTSLKFTKNVIDNIIKEIYKLEELGHSSPSGRTFKLNKGFHSVNLLDKNNGILDKSFFLKLLVSRIQEIMFNHFQNKNTGINYVNKLGALNITEFWCNILRVGDYNIPHNHPNCDISGNFYLNTIDPTKKTHSTDGALIFIKDSSYNYYDFCNDNELSSFTVIPAVNDGIIFRSWKRHFVLPHFTNEDRIGIAFNARYENNYSYDKIYPKPYWLPIKYSYIIKESDYDKVNKCVKIPFNISSWFDNVFTPQLKDNHTLYIRISVNEENPIGKNINLTYEQLKNIIHLYPNGFNNFFI